MTLKVHGGSTLQRMGLALMFSTAAASAFAADAPEEPRAWQATLGAGIAQLPEYPGASESRTQVLPVISARYKRFFVGGAPGPASVGGLGVYLYESDRWTLGAIASPDGRDPRREQDDERLRGLGDVDSAIRAGLFTSYRFGWFTLSASAMSDVSDKGQGSIANLDAQFTYRPLPQLVLSGGPGVTWSNGENMQTFFGVTADQASRSAFSPFKPGSGVSSVRLSLSAQYMFSAHWFLGARATASRLQGDAADSPVVVDENQNVYALFFGYRF